MKIGRKRIGGFLSAVLSSILFMSGVIFLIWILVWRLMGLPPLGRASDFLHISALEELTLSGDGYYEIDSPEDFERFWEGAAREDCAIKGRLLCDIYLNDSADMDQWSVQAPCYVSGKAENFYGVFDGGGHTIYGLYSKNGYGLAKYNRGTICNLTIDDSLVRGAVYSGGLCYSNAEGASIYNCCFYGNMVSSYASAPVRMSGISVLNKGRIERCGYAGQMRIKNNESNLCDMAGVCLRNEGVVKDCYNLSRQSLSYGGLTLAIADGGEKNCYMLNNSIWSASKEGQVLALDKEQRVFIEDYLNRDLAALFEKRETVWAGQLADMREGLSGRKILQAADQETECGTGTEEGFTEPFRLCGALRDGVVGAAVFEIMQEKKEDIGSFSFEVREREGTEFGLLVNCGQEGFYLYVYPFAGERSVEELWEAAGAVLACGEEESWQHETFALLPESGPGERQERILLYEEEGGEWGFFYSDGKKLYHFIPCQGQEAKQGLDRMRLCLQTGGEDEGAQTENEGVQTDQAEPLTEGDALFLHAFYSVCREKIIWDGIFWKDEAVKNAVYQELSAQEEGPFSVERIRSLDSLSVSPERTLLDLGMFSNLTSLYIDNYQGRDLEAQLRVLPLSELTRLGLVRCGIEDISFLEGMPLLEEVVLYFNRIEDIGPLSGMDRLRGIGLDKNKITDITPLKDLNQLESLSLCFNRIEDFSPIFGMDRLYYLDVCGNPSQDIGELYLVPGLSIGMMGEETGRAVRSMEREWAAKLLNSRRSGQGLAVEDLVWGDINGDGLMDVAITGYGGEEKDEEGRVSVWGTRQVFLFLGTEQGEFVFADAVEALGPHQGGAFGDPYMGAAISGGRLVVQCYGGSNFRWTSTKIYEYGKEGLVPVYELSLDNYVFASGGDWQVEDLREGTVRKYALARGWESHMEKLLLFEDKYPVGDQTKGNAVCWGTDALPSGSPGIQEWIYRPEINDGYYAYEIHDQMFDTEREPSEILESAARTFLADLVEFSIPIYSSPEIKASFDRLSGVELPSCFYAGRGQTGVSTGQDVELLTYEMCFYDENKGYVHVMRVCRPDEEREDWQICAYILYEEETDAFEVTGW